MAKRKVAKKNLSGLSGKTASKRAAQIRKRATQKPSYKPLAGDKGAKTRPSKHTTSLKRFRSRVSERSAKSKAGTARDKFIRSVAMEMKIPSSIVRQVYKRGEAAWAVSHRPGDTQGQWAKARVYSFLRKGNTVTKGQDGELYRKAKKQQRAGGYMKLR